jgi:hypothetical protein
MFVARRTITCAHPPRRRNLLETLNLLTRYLLLRQLVPSLFPMWLE